MTKITTKRDIDLVFTCEHGGYHVPARLKSLVNDPLVSSDAHFTWDPGASEAARYLADSLQANYFSNPYSRLLVDCNRSDNNPARRPKWTRSLHQKDLAKIDDEVFFKYKNRVRSYISKQLEIKKDVVVISVHSFTPVFEGKKRATELGVLYRTDQPHEVLLANELVEHLKNFSDFKVHRNRPYQGHTDCFLNELSLENSSVSFVGIMLEINYGLQNSQSRWNELLSMLSLSLKAVLG